MREDQISVSLWLDVGALDMATCAPLEDIMVDLWQANAPGSYSSFTGLSLDILQSISRPQTRRTDLDPQSVPLPMRAATSAPTWEGSSIGAALTRIH